MYMRSFGMKAAILDSGDSRPVVVGDPAFQSQLAAAWQVPKSDARPATITVRSVAGPATIVAMPIAFAGRTAWIAGIGEGVVALPDTVGLIHQVLLEGRFNHPDAGGKAARAERLSHEEEAGPAARRLGVGTLCHDFKSDTLEMSPTAGTLLGGGPFLRLAEVAEAFQPLDRAFVTRLLTGADPQMTTFDVECERAGTPPTRLRLTGEIVRSGGEPLRLFLSLHDKGAARTHQDLSTEGADRDSLTGAYNRSVLDDIITKATQDAANGARRAALFMVDVDNFKDVNDTNGRDAGDEVLRHVARTLKTVIGPQDVLIRLAGDEFAVVIAEVEDGAAMADLGERIGGLLRTRVTAPSGPVDIQVSLGLALFPDDVSADVDLYRAASQALFEAKADGGDGLKRFDPAMRERREQHRAFIWNVRAGLARGEFEPFFQPKLDLRTGCVVGFEALCRWRHPERGTLGPVAFFKAFDDRDIGGVLSDVALRGSFAAVRKFHDMGLSPGHIAVNLNQIQLERPELVDQIERLQAEFEVAPTEILFEVVENVLIHDKRTVYDNLTELFHRGFRVALDDFGTGFASLTNIREPFIREVKIDRSFVTNSTINPLDQQIVAAIVQMARKLGLGVVAEGIEDEETLKNLRMLGCTMGQGFVFSHALPFDDALQFIGRQERILTLLEGIQL
nr:bifunctional diguanylate cyclase/phosphodiesterase [Acuticoccus kalidii]